MTPGVSKSDNDEVCSTSGSCRPTSRKRSTWPRLHPSQTVDAFDAGDVQAVSRHYRDVNCNVQQQQQGTSDGGCTGRMQSAGAPRRHQWVACVQRQRSATSAHVQRPFTTISAAPQALRRQQTVSSTTADHSAAVDSAVSAGAVMSPSPVATTTGDVTSDEEWDAEHVLNYETVLRCLDSCDKILLRHSTVIT